MLTLNLLKRLIALIMALLMNTCLISADKLCVSCVPKKCEGTIRVMSQNLRYADDLFGSVENRSKLFIRLIEEYSPDSFGVQEATQQWIEILSGELSDSYGLVYAMRDEEEVSESSAVFYKKDKYDLLDSGTIWLYYTPDVPYSKLQISNLPRIATWAVLKNKETGEAYTHINTHLDNSNDETRTYQAQFLNEKIDELLTLGYPLICTGDFNDSEKSNMYAEMTKNLFDSRKIAKISDFGRTFHDYGNMTVGTMAIDYIFVCEGIKVNRFKIIDEQIGGMYYSDHYGIMADVVLSEASR